MDPSNKKQRRDNWLDIVMRVLSLTLALGSVGLLLANLISLENSIVILGLSIVVLVLDRFN